MQLYDVQASKMIRQFGGHQARVGALAWSSELLTSGSRDRLIYHRDHRSSDDWVKKLVGHKQEVKLLSVLDYLIPFILLVTYFARCVG